MSNAVPFHISFHFHIFISSLIVFSYTQTFLSFLLGAVELFLSLFSRLPFISLSFFSFIYGYAHVYNQTAAYCSFGVFLSSFLAAFPVLPDLIYLVIVFFPAFSTLN